MTSTSFQSVPQEKRSARMNGFAALLLCLLGLAASVAAFVLGILYTWILIVLGVLNRRAEAKEEY